MEPRSTPAQWSHLVESGYVIDPYVNFMWPFSRSTRDTLLSWMWEVGVSEQWQTTTIFLAVLYLDVFMGLNAVSLTQIQDVSIVCMMIACKVNETNSRFGLDFCRQLGADTLEAAGYRALEIRVLQRLQFRLTLVTYYEWVEENRWDAGCVLGRHLLLALGWDRRVRLPERRSARSSGKVSVAPPRVLALLRRQAESLDPPADNALRSAASAVLHRGSLSAAVRCFLRDMERFLGQPLRGASRKAACQALTDCAAQMTDA